MKLLFAPLPPLQKKKRIIFINFVFATSKYSLKNLSLQEMKINLKNQFYSIFDAFLIIIVLENKIIFSKENQEKKPCKATNESTCVVLCRDWNLDSKTDALGLKEILKAQRKKFKYCTLILENCTYTNHAANPWENIDPNDIPKIEDLRIFHSLIDLKELKLKFFKSLKRLTVKNTTTASLQTEMLHQVPKLEQLQIQENSFLKWVERGFLQNKSVNSVQIQGLKLNQTATAQFFTNLTDGSDVPSVRELDWSHNNFGNFAKVFLTRFPNLNALTLTNSNIFNFENGIFTNRSIEKVYINRNKIRKLPEEIFRPMIESASVVSLEGNSLLCDCKMEWLQSLIKKHKVRNIKIECDMLEGVDFLEANICPEGKKKNTKLSSAFNCAFKENSEIVHDYNLWSNTTKSLLNETSRKFSVTNEDPEFIEITMTNVADMEKTFLWFGKYVNATLSQFICLKILQQRFNISVNPDAYYLICIVSKKHSKIDIFDCLPLKTRPLHENQLWLSKKSISLSITIICFSLLLALAAGALILYLTVRKNPSLIRGSKRVIEVKRHDKAQILIMPRDYENNSQGEGSSLALMGPRIPLEPSRSCDTISTVSYVSANQPTQLEILTYRMNRLRQLFQRNNNIPSSLSSIPMQIATPINQRLPPNVDLLLEYEWYTITTTTTTKE